MSLAENTLNFMHTGVHPRQSHEGGKSHHGPGLEWLMPVAEVNEMISPSHDALLVGPADGYRVGEMLKPHVLTRVLNFSRFRCAGLVGGDFTGMGGHAVRNYGESAFEMAGRHLQLVHFGGDTLGRSLIDGYSDVVEGEEAERFESMRVIGDRGELNGYVRRRTGQLDDLAYVLASEGEFHGARSSFHAVGLPDPAALDEPLRRRLLAILKAAAFVGIRDETGADYLESEGVAVHRMPCALSVIPQVCARQLRQHRDGEALEALRDRFPNGWIAVEVGSVREKDFDRLAAALREVSEREGLGLAFFEANHVGGEAPSENLRRWVESFPEWIAAGFASDNIWEVASMLLHSRLYCGSCLESRIICMSGGVARLNVPTGEAGARSYCELWEHDAVPIEFSEEEEWSIALDEALAVDHSALQHHSTWLHETYFAALERCCRHTGMSARLVPGAAETDHVRASAAISEVQEEWLGDEVGLSRFRHYERRRRRRGLATGFVKERLRRTLGSRRV